MEKYKPSSEEVAKAEGMMTEEQREASLNREAFEVWQLEPVLEKVLKEVVPDTEDLGEQETPLKVFELYKTSIKKEKIREVVDSVRTKIKEKGWEEVGDMVFKKYGHQFVVIWAVEQDGSGLTWSCQNIDNPSFVGIKEQE